MLATQDLAHRAAALAERASSGHPTSWRPTDPSKGHPSLLCGVLVRVEHGTTSYGRAGIVVVREPDGTEWSVWLLHSVLRAAFGRLRPRIGELVAIRYEGPVEPANGRPGYERYSVVVDREEAVPDWDELAGDEFAPPAAEESQEPVSTAATVDPGVRLFCELCGQAAPEHSVGCPLEIPF